MRDCVPDADIVLVLNERDGPFVEDATPEGRAFREVLAPLLQRQSHVSMPVARARAIAAFAGCGHSIPEILAATKDELQQWSGERLLAARSCQTNLGAFYDDFGGQLKRVLPFRSQT